MLSFSTYSVISPEGCASILWKSADRAEDAAKAMGITADRLEELGLIDEVIEEPLGGAHRNVQEMADTLKSTLSRAVSELDQMGRSDMLEQRYARLMSYGQFKE